MSSSRYLILAAALVVALAVQGCNRDYKAPKPKTGGVAPLAVSFAVTTLPLVTRKDLIK